MRKYIIYWGSDIFVTRNFRKRSWTFYVVVILTTIQPVVYVCWQNASNHNLQYKRKDFDT
jgi:hypothetical protein